MAASRVCGRGTVVAEPSLVERVGRGPARGRVETAERGGRLLPRLGPEVGDPGRAVVLGNEGDERLGQLRPVGDVDPVGHVRLEDLGAHVGVELVVDVARAGLVLDEGAGVGQLADVVVVGSHARHERVGADRLGGPLGQVADHQGVVVGPRRLEEEPAQEGLRRVGQLEELEDREDPEEVAHELEGAHGGDRRAHARGQRGTPQLEDPGQVARPQQREDRDDDHVGHDDGQARLEEDPHPVAAPDRDDPGQAPDEDVGGELEGEVVGGTGQDGQHRRDHRGGPCAEEDRDQHRGTGARDEEGQDRAARGELVGEGGEEQHETEQGQGPGPVPELLAVAPRPGEQEDDDEDRQQEPAGQAGDVQARLGQPERLQLGDLERRHLAPGLDDQLALLDRVRHWLRRRPRPRRGRRP